MSIKISKYSLPFDISNIDKNKLQNEENEEWALIHNYKDIINDRYIVSNHGRIYDIINNIKKENKIKNNIYHVVYIVKNGRRSAYVHKLVYKYLSGDEKYDENNKKLEVGRIITDLNYPKYDYLENLIYGERSENSNKREKKITNKEIVEYDKNFKLDDTFKSIGILKWKNKDNDKEELIDFSNYYLNSNGILYNINNNCKLKQLTKQDGYNVFHLTKDKKDYILRVHRIIGKLFLPNGDEYFYNKNYQVHHKDKNPLNNNVENLEWILEAEHTAEDNGIQCYKLDLEGNIINTFKCKNDAIKDSGQKTLDIYGRNANKSVSFGFKDKFIIIRCKDNYYCSIPNKYIIDNKIDVDNLYINKSKTKICRADEKGNINKIYECYDDIKKEYGIETFHIVKNKETNKELQELKIMVKFDYLWKCRKMEFGKDIKRNLFEE